MVNGLLLSIVARKTGNRQMVARFRMTSAGNFEPGYDKETNVCDRLAKDAQRIADADIIEIR